MPEQISVIENTALPGAAAIAAVADAIQTGGAKTVSALVLAALEAGAAPMDVLNIGMIDAMSLVGERFSRGDAFVPEMLVSARTMKKGVETLKPYLSANAAGANGKVVIGTVAGDLHYIGKNLVGMMLESSGFEVIDLGIDVPIEKFVEAARSEGNVRIVALSTLLTTTMPAMRRAVEALNALENRASFCVMVGGAPITDEFARSIGADAYSPDAAAAAVFARSFVA